MASRAQAFTLTKWYLDCTGDDGCTAIGYWASLAWRGLSLTWQGLSVCEAGGGTIQRSTLTKDRMPARARDRIVWRSRALKCTLAADVRLPPIALRLFETTDGFVDWRCEAPAAMVMLEFADRPPIRGVGYADRLDLTIPPWQLPISELRWGRWTDQSAAHSVVWIDWGGAEPRTWVFVDGARAADAAVEDDRVSAGHSTLTLTASSTLSSRALDEILRGIPPLRAVVPSSLLSLRDTKWSSRGTLHHPGSAPLDGRAIHERVIVR